MKVWFLRNPNYVPFRIYKDVETVIKSKEFYPVFITGQSGNGKTMSVEQGCARNKRKYVCISMTPETDEGDLLGNYVLINGQMEWRDELGHGGGEQVLYYVLMRSTTVRTTLLRCNVY